MTIGGRDMRLIASIDLAGRGDCMHVNVVDGFAYVGHMGTTDAGTSVVDVTDPTRPRLVAQLPRPAGTHSHKVQVVGTTMLVNHERNRFEEPAPRSWSAGLAVYDVSRPDRPEQVGFLPSPGVGVHRMTYWEPPYAYVSGTDDGVAGRLLRIVDLSDRTNPTEVGRWCLDEQLRPAGSAGRGSSRQLHHALPMGDRLYCGWWDAGMVILDIADRTRPRLVSHLDFGPDSRCTHTVQRLPGRPVVLVTDEQITRDIGTARHVRVVDVSDESRPRVLATLPEPADAAAHRHLRFGPHNLHEMRPGSLVDPETVYLTYFAGGLRAYDVSDPERPVEIAHLVPEPPPGLDTIQFNDVTVAADGLIYVTDRRAGGLYVVAHDRSPAAG